MPKGKPKVIDIMAPRVVKSIKVEKPSFEVKVEKKEILPKEEAKKIIEDYEPILESKKIDEKIEALKKEEIQKIDKMIEHFEREEKECFEREDEKITKKFSFKKYLIIVIALLLVGGVIYAGTSILPKAKIKVTTKKTEWNYTDAITATKNASSIDTKNKNIPGEIFSQKKNLTFSFLATGKKYIERKASGKVTIYNIYSSQPQVFVANTRFLSPDGKIFKIDQRVVVPGAKVVEGKIASSSIEVIIYAEKPGPEYNIGQVSRFSIPGLQGTEKYRGFFAESKESMKGGFIGETVIPTENDIKLAKEKAVENFKNEIGSLLSSQIPEKFKVLDDSRVIKISKEEVNQITDEKGNFAVSIDGELSIISFDENNLLNLIKNLAKDELGQEFEINEYKLDYGVGKADIATSEFTFAIEFKGLFEKPVDTSNFKAGALGKNEKELSDFIHSMDNIEKANISFWPFWVKRVPNNINKVKIDVE